MKSVFWLRCRPLVVAGAAALVLVGCGVSDNGAAAPAGEGKTIAFFTPYSGVPRYSTIDIPTFESTVKDLCSDCEVIAQESNANIQQQQSQVEAAIAQGAEVIVLDPVDGSAMGGVATAAKQRNIPVVAYDQLVTNAPIDAYVGFDNVVVGQQLAESLIVGMQAAGTADKCVVSIQGEAGSPNRALFWEGTESVLAESGAEVCFDANTAGWAAAPAQTNMDQGITRVGAENIGGVVTQNDAMAAGIIAAFKAAGVQTIPPVVGQDAELAALQRMLIGDQYSSLWRNAAEQAREAAATAVALLNGEQWEGTSSINNGAVDVPAKILETKVITKAEVPAMVQEAGYIDVGELCAGQYAAACAQAGVTG